VERRYDRRGPGPTRPDAARPGAAGIPRLEPWGVAKNDQQFQKIQSGWGIMAALDQSGASIPGALQLYGIGKETYFTDEEMFALMHAFRQRINTSPSFGGDRILGAILI
jgi:fructose-bisphosphate aldolase class 1